MPGRRTDSVPPSVRQGSCTCVSARVHRPRTPHSRRPVPGSWRKSHQCSENVGAELETYPRDEFDDFLVGELIAKSCHSAVRDLVVIVGHQLRERHGECLFQVRVLVVRIPEGRTEFATHSLRQRSTRFLLDAVVDSGGRAEELGVQRRPVAQGLRPARHDTVEGVGCERFEIGGNVRGVRRGSSGHDRHSLSGESAQPSGTHIVCGCDT